MSKAADVNCDGDSSSADEYDNNKSFVKKVKSRVSGFIPSSLTKWFGAKIRQRDELDDDAEDDETYQLQPPSKRVKKSSSDNLFDLNSISTPMHGQEHTSFGTDPFREPVAGPSTLKARKLVLPAYNHFHQNQADQTNGVDSDSGESTSGYSSMPRIGSKEQVSELPDGNNAQPIYNDTTSNQNRSIFNTSIPHERSLFPDRVQSSQKSNTSLSSRRPSFNASAFGTPNFMDKTLSTRRIVTSPFYNGRITYGGASAYNRILNISTEQPSSATIEPRVVNEIKSTALSKTAKRILDTLEQYTSPVHDVRRIPQPSNRKSQRPEGLIGKYVGANPYLIRETQKVPSNIELQVPTMTDLLKMKLKERLQDSTTSVRAIASKSSSSLNTEEYSIRTNDDDKMIAGKFTNKIKTKVASVRQKSNACSETVPEVNLPDIQLPISTLPSFNFSIPSIKPSGAPTTKPVAETIANTNTSIFNKSTELTSNNLKNTTSLSKTAVTFPEVNFKSPEIPAILPFTTSKPNVIPSIASAKKQGTTKNDAINIEFKFSKPLIIAENNFKSIKAINNFKFSKPLVKKSYNGTNGSPEIISESAVPIMNFGDQFKMSANMWECSVCLVRNENTNSTCVSCTSPKPVEKARNGSATSTGIFSSWGDEFKAPSNTWECSMCMVRNDSGKLKCLACENPKPTPKPTNALVASKGIEGFKKKEDEWECSSCMVRNANTKQKCVCCDTQKPGAKSVLSTEATVSIGSTISPSWGDKFKAPSNTWECSMCLVRNDSVKEKCDACENLRPAGSAATKGIDGLKENEWKCTSCMVRNPSNKQRCVCCEAPKPGDKPVAAAPVIEVPKFSFGIENGLINGHGFVFGIPANAKKDEKKSEVDGTTSSIFGENKINAETTTNTQFSFGIKSPNGAKSTLPIATEAKADTFLCDIPATKKRSAIDEPTVSAETPKKSDIPIKPINGDLSKSSNTEPPKFRFGTIKAPAINTSNSFFSPPKTTEAASSSTLVLPADKSPTKRFSFGATPSFSFAEKPTSNTPFGTSAPAFGNNATANITFPFNAFESAPTQSTTPALGVSNITFGSNNSSAVTFGGSKPDPPASAFASSSSVPAPAFGTSSSGSTFAKPAANGIFGFRGNNQTDESKPSFNFGPPSATPSSSGFKFGAPISSNTQNVNGGFNFGGNNSAIPSFNADIKPTFNFTAGSAPATFTAQGSETKPPPARVIRRAIRRTQR